SGKRAPLMLRHLILGSSPTNSVSQPAAEPAPAGDGTGGKTGAFAKVVASCKARSRAAKRRPNAATERQSKSVRSPACHKPAGDTTAVWVIKPGSLTNSLLIS